MIREAGETRPLPMLGDGARPHGARRNIVPHPAPFCQFAMCTKIIRSQIPILCIFAP